jgi:hypothetical protein
MWGSRLCQSFALRPTFGVIVFTCCVCRLTPTESRHPQHPSHAQKVHHFRKHGSCGYQSITPTSGQAPPPHMVQALGDHQGISWWCLPSCPTPHLAPHHVLHTSVKPLENATRIRPQKQIRGSPLLLGLSNPSTGHSNPCCQADNPYKCMGSSAWAPWAWLDLTIRSPEALDMRALAWLGILAHKHCKSGLHASST